MDDKKEAKRDLSQYGSSPADQSRRDLLRLFGASGVSLLAPGFLAACGGDASISYDTTITDARAAIRQALAESDTPSASVALIDGERIIWAEAFGIIDKASRAPTTTETLFCVGSCSKVIAAIATMILVDRKLVALDAPLVQYVPDFRMASPQYAQVTPRMLLSHASGFPGSDGRNIFTFKPFPEYAAQVKQTLATQPLKHAPGEMAVYCNDGFTMIELLVAAVSGMPYTQFVQTEILAPLGMTRSRYSLAPFAAGSYATAYIGEVPQAQESVNGYATGGLYSTPSDMGRLAMMFINGGQLGGKRILSPAAVAEMGRAQNRNLTLDPVPYGQWGLGWDSVAQAGLAAAGVSTWQKNGGTAFYGSDFFVAPVERLAVMISGTSTRYGAGKLAERILLHALVERRSIGAMPLPLPEVPLPATAATAAELAAIEGYYAQNTGPLRVQAQSGDTLALSRYAEGAWQEVAGGLRLRSDGTFSSDAQPNMSYWTVDAEGRRYLALRQLGGNGHYRIALPYAERVNPKAALPAAWSARVGRNWLSVNEDAQSVPLILGGPRVSLEALPELPGFILCADQFVDATQDDMRAGMFLKIPLNYGRDLNDVVIEMRNGEEWLRVGSVLYRPQATVPTLTAGATTVVIDDEGNAEWRKLPAGGTMARIAGGSAWKLYDTNLALLDGADGGAQVPLGAQAAYLMLYGAAHAGVGVTLS